MASAIPFFAPFVLVRCRPAVLLFTAMRFVFFLLAYFLRLELLL